MRLSDGETITTMLKLCLVAVTQLLSVTDGTDRQSDRTAMDIFTALFYSVSR